MRRAIFFLAIVVFTTRASAEALPQFLTRVRADSPQIAAIFAELPLESARASVVLAENRPRLEAGFVTRARQDSTLPSPKPHPEAVWQTTLEWTILDPSRSPRFQASSHRRDAAYARIERRALEALGEAATAFVSAWKSTEVHASCIKALTVMRGWRRHLDDRRKDKSASDADLRLVDSEIASLILQCEQAKGDKIEAVALLSRYGAPARIEQPWLPATRVDPADASAATLEVLETDLQVQQFMAEEMASGRKRWPVLKAYGSSQTNPAATYSDFEAGVRVSLDVFDSQGTGEAARVASAELAAARARRDAALANATARITAIQNTLVSCEAITQAAADLLRVEQRRLVDAEAAIYAGRGRQSDAVQAARRIATSYRARIEAIAALVQAQIRHGVATATLAQRW